MTGGSLQAAARRRAATLFRSSWPVLVALVALLPFVRGLSTTNVFFVRDLGLFFWPRHLWLWQTVREGDWPLWDRYAAAGQSAVADPLNHFFLLPATIVRVLAPPVLGFNFWVAAPAAIIAIGTCVWLRRRLSAPAAAVGAAIAALAGPIASAGVSPNLSWTIALIPWILWSVDRFHETPDARRFTALALGVGLQAVAGEPLTFGATCAVVLGYAAVALPFATWADRRRHLVRVAAGLVAGVLLAAVQLAPLFHAASRSARGAGTDATYWSLHPLALVETIVPHLFGDVYDANLEKLPWVSPLNTGREPLLYSLYVGIGACALALVRGTDRSSAAWRRFWWLVVGVATVMAVGEHTVIYAALQRVVPILKSSRFPVKFAVLAVFAVAALAASGSDALIRHSRGERPMKRPVAAFVLLGATASIAALIGIGSMFQASAISDMWGAVARRVGVVNPADAVAWLKSGDSLWLRLVALAVVAAFMLAIVWRRHRAAVVATWVLCGVAVADPLSVNAGLYPTLPASRLGPPEWVQATRTHALDRVYVGGRLSKDVRRQQLPVELIDSPSRFLPLAEWTVQEAGTTFSAQFALTPAAWRLREVISFDLPQLWPREYAAMLSSFRNASPAGRLRFLQRTGHRYCFVPQPPFPGAPALSRTEIVAPMALYECHTDPLRVYVTPAAAVEPDPGRQIRAAVRRAARSVLDGTAGEECTGTRREAGRRFARGQRAYRPRAEHRAGRQSGGAGGRRLLERGRFVRPALDRRSRRATGNAAAREWTCFAPSTWPPAHTTSGSSTARHRSMPGWRSRAQPESCCCSAPPGRALSSLRAVRAARFARRRGLGAARLGRGGSCAARGHRHARLGRGGLASLAGKGEFVPT